MTIDSLTFCIELYLIPFCFGNFTFILFVQIFLPRTTYYKIKSVKRTTLGYTRFCRGFQFKLSLNEGICMHMHKKAILEKMHTMTVINTEY